MEAQLIFGFLVIVVFAVFQLIKPGKSIFSK